MWVFTRYGAVSIVRAPKSADSVYTANGLRCVQVRGRSKKHLDQILRRYCHVGKVSALSASAIQETPERDYPFRFYLSRQDAGLLAYRMAMDIKYENFKDAAKSSAGTGSVEKDYPGLLMRIWSAFFDWSGRQEVGDWWSEWR